MKKNLYLFVIIILSFYNKIYGQSDSFNIDEVIISANKSAENKRKVAQQVSIINTQKINLLQTQNPADLLTQSGIFVQKSQQGGGSPVLRGFEASRVLLIIDGVRMNNAIYRSGHLQNVITLDNNALERVEVLYGPSSTIYGSDALGGAISFISKKAKFKNEISNTLSGSAMARYSSVNNENTGNININFAGNKFATFTSITYSKFGDLVMGKKINPSLGRAFGERVLYQDFINGKDSIVTNPNKYTQVGSAYNQIDIIQKISHKLSDNYTHGLNIQYSNSSDIPRYDRLTDPSTTTKLNQAQWYYGPQKRLMIGYDINNNPNNTSSGLHFGIQYQSIEESRHTRRVGRALLGSRIENVDVISGSLDLTKNINKHSLRYGADFQLNKLVSTAFNTNISSNAVTPLDTRYPDGDNSFNTAGLYFSHTAELTDRLILNDGLRVGFTALSAEFVNKTFFPFPYSEANQDNLTYSANLGLNYLLGAKSKLSANFSSGFRTPNIDDLGKVFESTTTNLIVPNPDLKPEKTYNVDLGGTLAVNDNIVLQGVFFTTALRDAIVTDAFTFNGQSTVPYNNGNAKVVANQNKRKASITGFTFGVDAMCTEALRFESSGTYTKGVIDDTNKTPLDHIPPFIMRNALTYSNEKFTTSFFMIYNGWKRIKDFNPGGEDNQQYAPTEGMPSWYTLNFKANYRLNKNIQIMAGLDNIMDLQYRVFSSGINGAGRNLSISGKVNF
jgi:hemoglobin/transferrin/lactoferrin receptor protein